MPPTPVAIAVAISIATTKPPAIAARTKTMSSTTSEAVLRNDNPATTPKMTSAHLIEAANQPMSLSAIHGSTSSAMKTPKRRAIVIITNTANTAGSRSSTSAISSESTPTSSAAVASLTPSSRIRPYAAPATRPPIRLPSASLSNPALARADGTSGLDSQPRTNPASQSEAYSKARATTNLGAKSAVASQIELNSSCMPSHIPDPPGAIPRQCTQRVHHARGFAAKPARTAIRNAQEGPGTEVVIVMSNHTSSRTIVSSFAPFRQQLNEEGTSLTNDDDEFTAYWTGVDQYTSILVPSDENSPFAYALLLAAQGRDLLAVSYLRTTDAACRIVILPPPTSVELEEAVRALLSSSYGIDIGVNDVPEPDWLERYALPAEAALFGRIQELTEEIEPLEAQRVATLSEKAREREWLRMLFLRGATRETLVRRFLAECLGCEVSEPETPGQDDGTMTTPTGRQVVLEIKGTGNAISLQHARQLGNWSNNKRYASGEEELSEPWDGLLIGNPRLESAPDERQDPIGGNALKYLMERGYHMVTTSTLLNALAAIQRNTLDSDEFWNLVFETPGLYELEPETDEPE